MSGYTFQFSLIDMKMLPSVPAAPYLIFFLKALYLYIIFFNVKGLLKVYNTVIKGLEGALVPRCYSSGCRQQPRNIFENRLFPSVLPYLGKIQVLSLPFQAPHRVTPVT